jgi:hypothetical protein
MSAQHIHFFFNMRDQVKIYHWQTMQYARHKATDDVIKELDGLIDEFVEVFMGKYGRPNMTRTTNTVAVKNMTDKTATKFIKDCIAHINGPFSKSLRPTDTDLLNIRDEMLGSLNKLLYLYSLK